LNLNFKKVHQEFKISVSQKAPIKVFVAKNNLNVELDLT